MALSFRELIVLSSVVKEKEDLDNDCSDDNDKNNDDDDNHDYKRCARQ